jgi:23S rRNA (uracil1939-C5)-methyltransferase
VPLTLPGEEARVRIMEEKKSYASGEAEEIVGSAPGRITPACPYFGDCGGCQYQHANYESQLRFKQAILRETLERAGVRAPEEIGMLAGEPWAYRNRIRLAFDANGNPGYRGRRSHAVVPIAECPIAAPLLMRAALAAAEIARSLAPGFRLNEISLFCDSEETALLINILSSGATKAGFDDFARALSEKIQEVKGIELFAASQGRELPRAMAHCGENFLVYRAAGFPYRVDQGAFFQVNRWLVDALVELVTSGRAGALAWDLYAGVGLFARKLAAKFARVVAVESAPAATATLAHNLSGTNAATVESSTQEFLRRADSAERPHGMIPDLIIVDPPRTGLGAETATLLAQGCAPTLVYVSCDPATLARDLRALLAAGYAMERLTLADLFPQTFHIETIAELRLRDSEPPNSRAARPFS